MINKRGGNLATPVFFNIIIKYMKQVKTSGLLIFAFVLVSLFTLPLSAEDKNSKEDGYTAIELTVEGMHCPRCAGRLESQLEEIEGVKEVKVSFPASTAKLKYKPELTSKEAIIAVIKTAGYEVKE
jgi:copper chaperone CopZ